MRRYVTVCWDPDSDYLLETATGIWRFCALYLLVGVPAFAAYFLVLDLFLSYLPNAAMEWAIASGWRTFIVTVGPIWGCYFLYAALTTFGRMRSVGSKLRICCYVLIGLAILIVMIDAVVRLFQTNAWLTKIATRTGAWAFRLIVALLVLAIICAALLRLWKLCQRIKNSITSRVQPPRDTRSWQQKFTEAEPAYQATMLRQVSAEQLRS